MKKKDWSQDFHGDVINRKSNVRNVKVVEFKFEDTWISYFRSKIQNIKSYSIRNILLSTSSNIMLLNLLNLLQVCILQFCANELILLTLR